MPVLLVLFQHFLYDVDEALVGRFGQAIALRVIGCRVAQGNMKFVAKTNHLFGFKGSSVVSDDFLRAAKSRKDIALKELDNDGVIGLSAWDGLNPLGEIVGGC